MSIPAFLSLLLLGALGAAAWRLRIRAREAQELSAVLDSMAEGIWITDGHGTLVRHNRAMAQLLKLESGLVGQQPLQLLGRSELADAVARACGGGEPSSLDLVLGESHSARTLAVRVTGLGPGLAGSAAVFRDVTELRRLEKVRQDFVANVSHELRTPITAIRGYAETLRAGALADAAHAPQMVEVIHRQSERLSELVTDLLELAKLDAKQRTLSHGPVPLATTVARAADTVRPQAALKHIALALEVPSDLVALGDPGAIEQVLTNLLDNAVKYTPAGGRVAILAAGERSRVVLSVKDSGLGIEPKHLERVFERFYRVDRGRSRDMGGTGLGLSIVKHLVSSMEGDIHVESAPGAGSTFIVQLPRADSQGPVVV